METKFTEQYLEDIHTKMSDYVTYYTENHKKDPNKYFEELKEFTKSVGCELFNKTSEDYENTQDMYWANFCYNSELGDDELSRKVKANYIALCLLIKTNKKK